jgi:hypothetical protein
MGSRYWQARCSRPEDLVRPVRLDPTGLSGPTRGQARSQAWRPTSRGFRVPADVDSSVVEQRILEQSVRLPAGGALTAWAALRWMGGHYFTGVDFAGPQLPVPVVLGGWRDMGRDDLITVSRERFWWHELVVVDGVACAVPERALFDELRRGRDRREAVVSLEMAVAAELVTLPAFEDFLPSRNGWTGVPFVREVVPLAGGDCRSPQEVRMKLVWTLDAGFPTPVCNRPVFDLDGNLLGFPDLLDPDAGVVGEYDGADHQERDRRRRDNEREARFRDHGLEYFDLVAGDLRDRSRVVRRMATTRARAKFLPAHQRRWTLQPPPWWNAA